MKTEALKQALDRYAFDAVFGGAPCDEESMRVFPLSNWTEYDVWEYIAAEEIDGVPLYFAAVRPVVRRGGVWIVDDDERLPLKNGKRPGMRRVRFHTLGCYPRRERSSRLRQRLPKSSPNCARRASRSDQAG